MLHRFTVLLAALALLAGASHARPIEPESEDATVNARIAAEEQVLRAERAAYPAFFEEAYRRFPQIPRGVLESIAYVQSRWQHLRPEPGEADGHMPPAYGLMGLYAGKGFSDQVGQASRLLGVSRQTILGDPRWNVLAAAALLAAEIEREHGAKARDLSPEAVAGALARYAGFGPSTRKSAVQDFARTSFAFDVLLTLDRGVQDKGIAVPERAVAFERAFTPEQLVRLRAPFLRLDAEKDAIEVPGYRIDPIDGTLKEEPAQAGEKSEAAKSTDYAPALWVPASSSNYSAWRNAAVSAVTIHTTQGSYAGSIAWFQNPSARVSAHYVIRSSDGQVTQMVREAHTAWHVYANNSYTLGIEHEGYVSNSAWYTSAMYNASAALVRHFCARYPGIPCSSAYNGPSSSGLVVLPTSIRIKGHQHFPDQTHTDPGIYWDWRRYYALLNPASQPGNPPAPQVLDSFETGLGHFRHSPTYSGSTVGISSSSTAQRWCSMARVGSCSLQVKLVDNPNSNANWAVRLLSGGGNPGSNATLRKGGGRIGFWVYAAGTGLSAALGVDDSDGTERSIARTIPANTWTYLEWRLDENQHWNAWVGGNGFITSPTVTLDAIWLFRAQTRYPVYVYIDQLQISNY